VLRVDAGALFRRWQGIKKRMSSYATATFVFLDTHLAGTIWSRLHIAPLGDRDANAIFRCPIRRDALLTMIRAEPRHQDQDCSRGTVDPACSDMSAPYQDNIQPLKNTVLSTLEHTRAGAYRRKKKDRDRFRAREGPLVRLNHSSW
jgi:hypothetical protein